MAIIIVLVVAAVATYYLMSPTKISANNPDGEPGNDVPDPADSPPTSTGPHLNPDTELTVGKVEIMQDNAAYSKGLMAKGLKFDAKVSIKHSGPERRVWVAIALGKANVGGWGGHESPTTIDKSRLFVKEIQLDPTREDLPKIAEVVFREVWPDVSPGKYDVLRIVAPREIWAGSVDTLVGGRYDDDWDDDVFTSVDPSNHVSLPDRASYA